MNHSNTYPSKISFGLLVIIILSFYGFLIPDIIINGFDSKTLQVLGILTLFFVPILYIFLGTRYIIENESLIIKCGPFKYKPIDIHQIKSITNTKSIMSSPSASFDRIEIKYGKFDDIIISPKDKKTFITHLLEINVDIEQKIINKS